jgi:WD40 repeat protein
MVLQASLHSHTDYITDLDVSKCNQYFASSSKDGKIIVWDLMKCKKLDEISAHQSSVNNIKFFMFKDKKDPRSQPFQILLTCSEDGTIKIYDEMAYLS